MSVKTRPYQQLAEDTLKRYLGDTISDTDALLVGILGAQLEIIDLLDEMIVHLEERRNL